MASYAPLLAKQGHTQWNPNLIYFNNTEVMPTVDYFVQKLYGENSGDIYLPSEISVSDKRESVQKRIAVSVVRNSRSNDLIVKMVNMLPVAIRSKVKLQDADQTGSSAICTVLTGKPDDKTARPVTENITVSDIFTHELPAYSFTVIRIKHN